MKVVQNLFGNIDGREIHSYTIKNKNGMEFSAINYGCIITSIRTPDAKGNVENVVLGFDTMEEYIEHSPFFGCVVGRVAGRIEKGSFELDGQVYKLATNDGNNHLHGGIVGLDKVVWDVEIEEQADLISLIFSYESKDGDEGYPGNIRWKVFYTLNNQNELEIRMEALSDKKTIINLTNHTYFNLSGNGKRDILNHQLTMNSNHFLELNHESIPTGKLIPVEGTVFDFQKGRLIRDGVDSENEQNILVKNGYDHPFVLDGQEKKAILLDEESGRMVTVETNQPALVLYTGNQLEDNFSIRGVPSRKHLGLCLETQGYPDAINHNNFPSIVVDSDELYQSSTRFTFGLNK